MVLRRWITRGLCGLLLGACLGAGQIALAEETSAGVVFESAETVRPLLVGLSAPGGVLKTGEGKPFDLGPAISAKPAVLVFYRGIW